MFKGIVSCYKGWLPAYWSPPPTPWLNTERDSRLMNLCVHSNLPTEARSAECPALCRLLSLYLYSILTVWLSVSENYRLLNSTIADVFARYMFDLHVLLWSILGITILHFWSIELIRSSLASCHDTVLLMTNSPEVLLERWYLHVLVPRI